MLFGLLVFGAIVGGATWFVATYNNLVTAAHRTLQAWGNLDALLRQRHDELPKLIELCERELRYERPAFDQVLAARADVFGARQARDTAALGTAERALRAALRNVLAKAAQNSALASDGALAAIGQRVAALETGIMERAELFDDAVRQNNAAIARFPGIVIAALGGFRRWQPTDIGSDA
jgi:LemA protein